MPRVKNPDNETKVKGVRAKPSWWDKVVDAARSENKNTNKFIVDVVDEYCDFKIFRQGK